MGQRASEVTTKFCSLSERLIPWNRRFILWAIARVTFQLCFVFFRDWQTAGVRNALTLCFASAYRFMSSLGISWWPHIKYIKLKLRKYPHPIYFRVFSSDEFVIRQVILSNLYDGIQTDPDAKYVVDGGANIGCAAICLLEKFPNARIVAVEPEEKNLQICHKNLDPYGDRVVILQKALWSSIRKLSFDPSNLTLGNEWSVSVREGDGYVVGITIEELLLRQRIPRVDFLKIDIEGAEKELFNSSNLEWLKQVNNLAVEIHGEECKAAVFEALRSFKYQHRMLGELDLFANIKHGPNG